MAVYRVLIVDDQREVRRMLRAALETVSPEIKVTDVPSGEEAILVISRQPIDLLISDVRLPGISGLELKDRARMRNPNMRMILITGVTEPKIRREVADAGVDAYFFKPIEMGPFLDLFNTYLAAPDAAAAKPAAAAAAAVEPKPASALPPVMEAAPPLPLVAAPPDALRDAPRDAPRAPQQGALAEARARHAAKEKRSISRSSDGIPSVGLAERLAGLRQDVPAIAVLLVDQQGQVMAQAGEMPPSLGGEPILVSLGMLFGASTRLALLLGLNLPRDLLYLPGPGADLYLTHVGQNVGLLVVTANGALEEDHLGKLLRQVRQTAHDLLEMLATWGVPLAEVQATPDIQPAEEALPEVDEAELEAVIPELDAIFGKAKPGTIKSEEVDAFWDALTNDAPDMARADSISWDQAMQLGLAPDDK